MFHVSLAAPVKLLGRGNAGSEIAGVGRISGIEIPGSDHAAELPVEFLAGGDFRRGCRQIRLVCLFHSDSSFQAEFLIFRVCPVQNGVSPLAQQVFADQEADPVAVAPLFVVRLVIGPERCQFFVTFGPVRQAELIVNRVILIFQKI